MAKGKNVSTKCSGCGGDLGDRYMKYRYCKACHAGYMRETRPKHSELSVIQRQKANARAYAREYLRRGKLQKENCRVCGSPDAEIHHTDYSKPIDVIWLCREHHLKEHNCNG